MDKAEARKWGLIFLDYGYGEECEVTVKEKESHINTTPISDLYVVDKGDHDISEDDYEVMECKNFAMPSGMIPFINFHYELEADDEFHIERIKFPKSKIFELAKIFIKAALSSKYNDSEYFTLSKVMRLKNKCIKRTKITPELLLKNLRDGGFITEEGYRECVKTLPIN